MRAVGQCECSTRPIWPAILLGGVGAAGVAVGVAGFVLAAQRDSDLEELAGSPTCQPTITGDCITQGEDIAGEKDSFNAMGIAGVAIGGAALIGMTIYLVLPQPSNPQKARATVAPWFGPGVGGLSAYGTF